MSENSIVLYFDNRRPQHPIVLTPDKRYVVVRTEVIREVHNLHRGTFNVVTKHYVEQVRP